MNNEQLRRAVRKEAHRLRNLLQIAALGKYEGPHSCLEIQHAVTLAERALEADTLIDLVMALVDMRHFR